MTESIPNLGTFEFFEHYFIGRINEGVNAGRKHIAQLRALIFKQYSGAPIIYISDRKNSYSIDPLATKDLIANSNIVYAAVVLHLDSQKKSFPIEKTIISNITLEKFGNLNSAVAWAKTKIIDLPTL